MEVVHVDPPLYCKNGTCSYCGKYGELCMELEPDMVEEWEDENNKPILCQECDDLCWIHERPVINTPLTACCCEMSNTENNEAANNEAANNEANEANANTSI
jgi:hypothetical protein